MAPVVRSVALKNIVRDLYKGIHSPQVIGTGSTADAIRYELRTGLPVGGRFHSQKGQEYINALNRWMRRNPNADHHDQLVAHSLRDDLTAALAGN